MKSLDPLGGISVFVKVAETLNFSSAARQLGLSKTTVSVQLRELEARLGVRLLHRSTKGVSLTEAGKVYRRALADVMPRIIDAEREAKSLQAAAVGELRISVSPDLGQLYMAAIIAEFTTRYPNISVHMDASAEAIDLITGGFDLAIRATLDVEDTLIVRKLAATQLVVCASPGYLKTSDPIAKPSDLQRHQCLHFGPIRWGREWRFGALENQEFVPINPRIETNDSICLRDCALGGAGVALLPMYVVAPQIESGSLVQVLSEWEVAEIPILAIYPANRHIAPKVKLFVDLLSKQFKSALAGV